jgi:hypothetical protein
MIQRKKVRVIGHSDYSIPYSGIRTRVICWFGEMGEKFELVSPPRANQVIAKTIVEDFYDIINNHRNPYKHQES